VDGINERGLAVAVAGVRETTHEPQEGEQLVFVTFLIRKILDQTKTVDEAVALARTVTPFDLDKRSVNSHLIVADTSGNSAILEFDEGEWTVTYGEGNSQVLTNKMIHGVSEASLREACWRYKGISEALETTQEAVDWQAALSVLRDAHQKGTTWSVVYLLASRQLYLSVYQDWDTVYRIRVPGE
jgi:penicillin V acylase-like amidase (Ntn superfamily)